MLGTIAFRPASAEINGAARAILDRIVQNASGARVIELRSYATGRDFTDARNVALARGLSVLSYLVDRGVRARIEIGAFASNGDGAGSDRIDVLGP